MYLFHKKTKVLRVLALLCAFALGLCMTGGFQMTEAKTTYSETETALFDELDHRAQADGVSFSAAMRQAGENAQALWHKHLADES